MRENLAAFSLYYVPALGAVLTIVGSLELAFPQRAYQFWRNWARHRLFFLYGIILVAMGFPFTIYDGPLSGIIFVFGIITVIMGPFIILYPQKFKEIYENMETELDSASMQRLLRAEALLRAAIGVICLISLLIRVV